MDKQELNKKLAEWAGIKAEQFEHMGDIDKGTGELPDFTQSLDTCFKWLVPKYIAKVCKLPMGLTSVMNIYAFLFAEWLKVMQEKIEPAPALCLVIEKLVDSLPSEETE